MDQYVTGACNRLAGSATRISGCTGRGQVTRWQILRPMSAFRQVLARAGLGHRASGRRQAMSGTEWSLRRDQAGEELRVLGQARRSPLVYDAAPCPSILSSASTSVVKRWGDFNCPKVGGFGLTVTHLVHARPPPQMKLGSVRKGEGGPLPAQDAAKASSQGFESRLSP